MRALASFADVLAAFAGPRAGMASNDLHNRNFPYLYFMNSGLRSGPARNKNWQLGFELLAELQFENAVRELAKQRTAWFFNDTPELMMRAARHYERAAQVMICLAVQTAQCNVAHFSPLPSARTPLATWVQINERTINRKAQNNQ